MSRLLPFVTIFIVSILITGCSSTPDRQAPQEVIVSANKSVPLADSQAVKKKLYQQYHQWKGVKYKLGGLSKKGVDCSGLVYATYREKLGVTLPRTTKLQSKVGKEIQRDALRPGDLVFFKTGFKVRHVGIYIENEKFLHASTKKGVMISKLSDYYWKDKYWHARRTR